MNLADDLFATDFQPRAARFADDVERFQEARELDGELRRRTLTKTILPPESELLPPLSYHAWKDPSA